MSLVDASDNSDQVGQWLDQLVDTFQFDTPGKDQSLGRDLAGVVAEGIRDRSVPDAKAADGSTWPPNVPKWAARKRRKYSVDQPGILTGQMLSLEALIGEVRISGDVVELVYGTGSSASGEGADAPTDRQKADWFSNGTDWAPERPFFELDDEIAASAVATSADALGQHLKSAS